MFGKKPFEKVEKAVAAVPATETMSEIVAIPAVAIRYGQFLQTWHEMFGETSKDSNEAQEKN